MNSCVYVWVGDHYRLSSWKWEEEDLRGADTRWVGGPDATEADYDHGGGNLLDGGTGADVA